MCGQESLGGLQVLSHVVSDCGLFIRSRTMRRSRLSMRMLCWTFLIALSLLATATHGADFTIPPMAERDSVAALAKQGGRIQINADYRVVSVSLAANTTN